MYFKVLPEPLFSDKDLAEVPYNLSDETAELVWNSWSQDPIKATVFPALFPQLYGARGIIICALTGREVCILHLPLIRRGRNVLLKCVQRPERYILDFLNFLAKHPGIWGLRPRRKGQ